MKPAFTFFKGIFIAGTVVLVPIIGTVWLLKSIILWTDSVVISLLPTAIQPSVIFGRNVPGLGILATLVLILLVGLLTRLYIGRAFVQLGDRLIAKIPLGKSIYGAIKQFVTAISSAEHDSQKKVVAVDFPRPGCRMVGFVTGDAPPALGSQKEGENLISVFVPTTPNPTTGFLIMLSEKDVTHLDMTSDEAFKLIVSAGLVPKK